MNRSNRMTESAWHVPAAVAAWLVPGLGHFLLGERWRGLILAVTIGALWLGGLALGGVSVCNRQKHPAWFLGQMLLAPSWVVDRRQQSLRVLDANPSPTPTPDTRGASYEPSFGHMNEQGILFTALAGLLNLLTIIDVLYRDPEHRSRTVPATPLPH